MDHSLDFLELLGSDGVIQGVSAAIKALGGYDPADLVGTHYEDLVHPEDLEAVAATVVEAIRGHEPAPIRVRYRCKDGNWRTILASVRSFLDDPAVHAIVVLTRDVTEQLDAEASLDTANHELRRLSQQLLVAQETERSYIARELHDDVQQTLVGIRLSMETERRTRGTRSVEDPIQTWIPQLQEALEHLHDLTMKLRPPTLGNRGLALELRAHLDRVAANSGHRVGLEIEGELGSIPPGLELTCFRIVQEGIANFVKHSGAREAHVSLRRSGQVLTLLLRDDGVGFDVVAGRSQAIENGNIGLLSMRERTALAGGRFAVKSSPGHGTQLRATFPIPDP